MNRSAWVCVRAGLGTPTRVGATLALVLYAYTPAVLFATGAGGLVLPRGREIATGLFALPGLLLAWLLLGGLLELAGEMRRLRLPDHRPFLAATAAIILGLTFLAPAALLFVLDRSGWEVLALAVACGTGVAAAFLRGGRQRGSSPAVAGRRGASGLPAASARAARRLASRALRMALGPPYAPASWARRLSETGALCAVVAGIPALALVLGAPLRWLTRTQALHAGELLGLLVAAGLCWTWPLYRVWVLLNRRRGAATELAVLPGFGDGRQQRRRLYRTILAVPGAGLGTLLVIALGVAWLQREPPSVYLRLASEFVALPLSTLPIVFGQTVPVGQTVRRRAATTGGGFSAVMLLFQTWWCAYAVWVAGSLWSPGVPGQLRSMAIALLSALPIILLCLCFYQLRKFARLPHPFVEPAG